MKKKEFIEKYGGMLMESNKNKEEQSKNPTLGSVRQKKWRTLHPTEVLANSREYTRKGGKHYKKRRQYHMSGIPHAKNLIRKKHLKKWAPYKQIIAPASQLHHEWIPETADFRGVALVKKDQHLHGFIDVIQILEGEITLLTESEIRRGTG